ncbi:Las1-domain-containing protein [Rickenella mellea]|uniref:Las1-domain-containing protein n=1 Tax=Rickenella mellea TaxID=50990 RepID=A0A4Y7QN94_9AGAM|nr:Las1-domain-containing protein [Rickenella mellea]
MKLSRRTPWANLAELDYVCNCIYADVSDLDAKQLAIDRLSAWSAITQLPHALEATLFLLTALVLDRTRGSGNLAGNAQVNVLPFRQAYASALIRLVNGLVDPLQIGAYARPIASIAAQIGLPAWLVDLRHAATHEDLPSLELLRTGAHDAMTWLLHNYFLPTLSPAPSENTSSLNSSSGPVIRPLSPLLKQYKALLKLTTRDASLASRHRPEITRCIRAIERWAGEAKVASTPAAAFGGWDADTQEGDMRERWALDRLCEELLARDGMVPVSPKKRVLSRRIFSPNSALLAIWYPLLQALHTHHLSLPAVLVFHIISTLLAPAPDDPFARRDLSRDMCLAGWVAWLVDTWGVGPKGEAAPENGEREHNNHVLRREDVVASLVTALGTDRPDIGLGARQVAEKLLDALCAKDPHLKDVASLLRPVTNGQPRQPVWSEEDARIMTERLTLFLSNPARSTSAAPSTHHGHHGGTTHLPGVDATNYMEVDVTPADTDNECSLPPGWKSVGKTSNWVPCPIGVFIAT